MIERLAEVDVVDLVCTLPHHPANRYVQRPRSAIDRIVIHHSVTPGDYPVAGLARYHVRNHGWPGIGYHFVVAGDGTCYRTNPIETQSFHAAGWNRRSVGVCFLGNFMQEPPPAGQIRAGAGLIGWLLAQLTLVPDQVVGHGELMATACPGRQWLQGARWKDALLQEINIWLTRLQMA